MLLEQITYHEIIELIRTLTLSNTVSTLNHKHTLLSIQRKEQRAQLMIKMSFLAFAIIASTHTLRPLVEDLENSWHNLIWNQLTVFLIIFTILRTTLLGISLCSVHQKQRQEDSIEHDQNSIFKWICQEAPRVSHSELKEVLKMPCHTPEP